MADVAQLRAQYDLHRAACEVATESWLAEVRRGSDHAERVAAEAVLKAAMADLELDIDLLWRHFAEGEVPTD